MSSYADFEHEAPDLARQVRSRLDLRAHKTIATLRRDGSPRISGTETFWADGELWIGSMWQARKAIDLQRDPRFALHSGSDDPPDWTGDAKLAGRALEITDKAALARLRPTEAPSGPIHMFRLEISEASVVRLAPGGEALDVEVWTPDGGVRLLRPDG